MNILLEMVIRPTDTAVNTLQLLCSAHNVIRAALRSLGLWTSLEKVEQAG